jgi:pilus retraction protein PilT
MRLLDRSSAMRDLADIGFSPYNLSRIDTLIQAAHGILLVTGPTGSGKTSTLYACLSKINRTDLNILTIEDPVEYQLKGVGQVQVNNKIDLTFASGLRSFLRQDPDVIMVGEMRDSETIMTAMTAAETGHLVFSTLHTNSAAQSIDRIIDSFPEGQHRQIRIQLSQVLKGIISLKLVERCDGPGLIAAVEILRDNPRIHKLILEGSVGEIEEEMEKSVAYFKMQSMNQSLIALILNGAITKETAIAVSTNPADLDLELRKFLFGAKLDTEHSGEIGEISASDFMEMGSSPMGGEDLMAAPLSDFSKIQELQEIKKVYDESRSKHMAEMAEKDEAISHLQDDIRMRGEEVENLRSQIQTMSQEREKLKAQLVFTKNDLEAKIQRLQERIQQLSAPVKK